MSLCFAGSFSGVYGEQSWDDSCSILDSGLVVGVVEESKLHGLYCPKTSKSNSGKMSISALRFMTKGIADSKFKFVLIFFFHGSSFCGSSKKLVERSHCVLGKDSCSPWSFGQSTLITLPIS